MRQTAGLRAAATMIALTTAAALFTAVAPLPGATAAASPPGPVSQPACAALPKPGMTACALAVSAPRPARQASRTPDAAAATTAPAGYGPFDLQSAYDLPSVSAGMLETVAVVVPFGYPDAWSDLETYRAQYNELTCPEMTSTTQTQPWCFSAYTQGGDLVTPTNQQGLSASTPWSLIAAEQLDTISAVCPNCRLMLIEPATNSISDVVAGITEAVLLGANVVTTGAWAPESSEDPDYDADIQSPGVPIVVPTGDAAQNSGYMTDGVLYPAASQYVTAVGGTTLTQAGTGSCSSVTGGARAWCETVWNDSYGSSVSGCSLYDPKPSWQPATDTACGSLRSVADVAADADPATGVATFDSDDMDSSTGTGWQGGTGVGGTAVAAAIVAGEYALAGTPGVSNYPAAYPYEYSAGLNDITSGTNTSGTCSPTYMCTAGAGYDGPTGMGSPANTAAFTSSGDITGAFYNGIDDMCMDDTGDASTSGTKIQIWSCGGDAAQQWTVESNGTMQNNGKCLALVTPTSGPIPLGTKIQLWACLAGDTNQQWHVQPQHANSPNPGVELVNGTTGYCLENDGGTTDGTQLELETCNGDSDQDWTLPYRGPGTDNWLVSSYPPSGSTPLCADNFHGNSTVGNVVDVYTCNANPASESWLLDTDGTIRINGLCVDTSGQATTAGTAIDLNNCNGQDPEVWRFLSDGSIMNVETGLCLDETSTTTIGTQLRADQCRDTLDVSPPGPPDQAQGWMNFPYSSTVP
jgi:hypothetical protein